MDERGMDVVVDMTGGHFGGTLHNKQRAQSVWSVNTTL